MPSPISQLVAQMDRLYEFDREPVSEAKLQGGSKFAAIFAGEHVAATEFVIGAFFVLHGVSAKDLIYGLLLGNTLAVLTWTLICAPIATATRLTMYWYLRRIVGPGITTVYNVVNAVLFCVIAGAMISVSATAVGLAFGVPSPQLTDILPSSVGWVVITVAIGSLMTIIAILGFEKVSKFAEICAPWIFVVFIAGAIAMLPRLGVYTDLNNLWEVAQTKVWNGVPSEGQEKFGFWHIVFFAWICNGAMHFGLSDMALFRYAKHWTYGLYSAFGMFPGHMLAWMCSGIMVAAVGRDMNPGLMAFEAAGIAGAFAVLVAGWTTANPTLYRSGLALQCVTPNWPRWKVTLIAGAITTVLSCFPIVFLRLLDYVAIYGLVLIPVGAIVFAEHMLFPVLDLERYEAETAGHHFNKAAAVVWGGTLLVSAIMPVDLFFRPPIAFVLALCAYSLWKLFERGKMA
jgi:purine-cytosine permease-like protein